MGKSNLFFNKRLILWYLDNKRDLPWRATKDPYFIWLSEIILQQTKVEQGMPYYHAFVKEFPSINKLANAPEEKVLKLWQGLGYYSRARNLHFTAKYIVEELNSVFPNTYKDLIQLKGVGDYTASAIASICFNESTAVVDGNVYRVLSRVFGIETPINSTAGIKEFKVLAQSLIDSNQSGIYNQAVMEFGARHCKPKNPLCDSCIFNDKCKALQTKKVSELPVKIKKTKIKKVFFNYIVMLDKDKKTYLKQRTGKGIWQNLYEFPLIETPYKVNKSFLETNDDYTLLIDEYNLSSLTLYNDKEIIHKLSHRHIYTQFWIVKSSPSLTNFISKKQLIKFPVPTLIENFINSFFRLKEEI